jgi:hypothetical protein
VVINENWLEKKNAKKQKDLSKSKKASDKKDMSLEARKHRDAEIMREKQKKKAQ